MFRLALLLAGVVIGTAIVRATPSYAATLLVDDDRVQCPAAAHTSIQAAVLAAAPGDTIEVCPGTYAEHVSFDAGKDRLTLRSQRPGEAQIEPPEALANLDGVALIAVRGARDITIDGFQVTGPIPIGICTPTPLSGVLVQDGGSATLRRMEITAIGAADPQFTAGHCSPGYGVFVRAREPAPATSVRLTDSRIDDYVTAGVLVEGMGAHAVVEQNEVVGVTPPPTGRRVSVEVRQGATAVIRENDLGRNGLATGSGLPTVGVSLIRVGGVQVEGNRVVENDEGITLQDTAGSVVRTNTVEGNTRSGIAVVGSSSVNTIEGNDVRGAGGSASAAPPAGVSGGIFPGGEGTGRPSNPRPGTLPVDCIDYTVGSGAAGTANQWRRNSGFTAIPAGICGAD